NIYTYKLTAIVALVEVNTIDHCKSSMTKQTTTTIAFQKLGLDVEAMNIGIAAGHLFQPTFFN
ncbi:MAG TPA: hypothetical protein VF540_12710, partial [Segetibacter sp.]